MTFWTLFAVLLADEGAQQPQGSPLGALLVPMLMVGMLWFFIILRPQRKEQAKREQMLNALKKNERVVTIGGIIGTVAQTVSEKDTEIILKVDDNTRIRFLRSSIQRVLSDESTEPAKAAP